MRSIRWAFNFGSWKPTQREWLYAARCIQQEEKDRIGRFLFTKDSKSSMAGRLMIRKAITDHLKIPWSDICLFRTDRGKPCLANINSSNDATLHFPDFNFNASHHGSFSVLAAEEERACGIDVMGVERPGTENISEFFRLMQRQFTPYEWQTIRSAGSEWQQLEMFYRHWCLKESYVKAIGTGLGISLQRVEFHLKTLTLHEDAIVTDTQVYFDGKFLSSWCFEETMLDETHYVAVALNSERKDEVAPSFKMLTYPDLISSATPILPEDTNYWTSFASKQERPVRQRDQSVANSQMKDL